MVSCPSLAGKAINGGDDTTCEKANGGFGFWIISAAPTADQMAKMCGNPTCMGIITTIKKVQPTECVVSFGFALYAEVINPIEAVCAGKPVAPAPAPAPGTPPTTPASPAAAGGTANAATSGVATAPTATQAAVHSATSDSNSQLTLIFAIAGAVIVLIAIVGIVAYRVGNKRKRRRQEDADYYRRQRAPDVRRDEPDAAAYIDVEAVRRHASRKNLNKEASRSMGASTASMSGKTTVKNNLHDGRKPAPMLTGLWGDLDINNAHINFDEIVINPSLPLLGHGNFCEVLAAKFGATQKEVAVKRLLPTKRHDIAMQKMLLAEAKTMTKVNHRNIVQLIGVTWQETSDLCVVMELVKGTDMGKYIAFHKRQQFPRGFNAEKILMALQIADALAYLHGQSPPVIHRDLKPTNVLLTDRNQVKLADFGVTRENNGTIMTSQVGATKWMAPELALSQRYDAQVDIFSFGVLLSELDTYEEPYSQSLDGRERSEIEFFQDVRSGHLRVTFSGDESRPITRLARECVRVHPHDRPTAAQLFLCLQKIYFDYQENEKARRALQC